MALGKYNFYFIRNIAGFHPLDLVGSQLYYAANRTNTLNAANFVAANSEFLSSTSSDFNVGDEDFSIGMWIKANSTGFSSTVFSKWIGAGNQRSYAAQFVNSATLRFFLSANGGSSTAIDLTAAFLGNWNFILIGYDSVNNLLYSSVNGGSFNTVSHSGGGFSSSTADFRLASLSGAPLFNGAIDGAFFYHKALSLSEVQALYNSNIGISYESLTDAQKVDLVSWWEMNEESGTRFDEHGTNDLTDNNTVGYTIGKIQEPTESGEKVYRWLDQSPNAYDLTQATAIKQPTYDGVSVNFDGVDDVLLRNVANPFGSDTLGVVYFSGYFNSGSPNRFLNSSDNASINSNIAFSALGTGEVTVFTTIAGTGNLVNGNTILSDGDYFWARISSDGSAYTMVVNGVTQVLTGINTGDWFGDVASRDNISIGALVRSVVLYGETNVNKIYYNNTNLLAADLTKLDTFFSSPNNY